MSLLHVMFAAMAGDTGCALLLSVVDDMTAEPVPGVEFTLLANDTLAVDLQTQAYGNGYKVEFCGPLGAYTLLAEAQGYGPVTKTFDRRSSRMGSIGLGTLRMTKAKERHLDEVTITTTHVKMVMRGDTVVYDAAAFQLAEGSMLDALVSQLPGAELKDGRITVNGKWVENLLVNGEDFFSGNPKVALQNLPAYTVKNIKVYDRASKDAYLKGVTMPGAQEHIVMDVNLKREYSVGWLGNLAGGYGVNGRYMGTAFGLGFTDRLRVAAFGNVNNVKDTRSANTYGWGQGWPQNGVLDLTMGGADYLWKKRDLTLSGSLQLSHEDSDVRTAISSVSYYEAGDVYGRSGISEQERKLHLTTSHQLQWASPSVYLSVSPDVDWMRNHRQRSSRSADFDSPLCERYRGEALDSLFGTGNHASRSMLNATDNSLAGRTGWLSAGIKANATVNIPGVGDYVKIEASYRRRRDTDTPVLRYVTLYGAGTGHEGDMTVYGQVKDYRTVSDDAYAKAYYSWWLMPYSRERLGGFIATPFISVSHSRVATDNILRGDGEGMAAALPSVRESVQLPVDTANTYRSTTTRTVLTPGMQLELQWSPGPDFADKYRLSLTLQDNIRFDGLDYTKSLYYADLSRSAHLPQAAFSGRLDHRDNTGSISAALSYDFKQDMPPLRYSLLTSDTSDPMKVWLNNPNLTRGVNHTASLTFNAYRNATRRSVSASLSFRANPGAVAMTRRYDPTTGVSTYRPENVDGNHTLDGNVGWTVPFGRNDMWQLTGTTSGAWNNSVDYAGMTEAFARSVVRNLSFGQQAGLGLRAGKHTASVSGGVNWLNAASLSGLFDCINALNWNARAETVLNLAYDWQIATDLNFYARRGYTDNTLNTTDWIWNASIAKQLCRGSLTVKLEGVDILGGMRQVTNSINAQGRTETWHNTTPRYAMLQLLYRFNVMPKRAR